jgi:hypothetical protein
MKINEILAEQKIGPMRKRHEYASRGLHKFQDVEGRDRFYELYRIMMATASSNGVDPLPDTLDAESWAGRYNIAAPMTDIEAQMLKQAYEVMGSKHIDLNHGDNRSMEVPSTYKKSPVAPKKRNKYGV